MVRSGRLPSRLRTRKEFKINKDVQALFRPLTQEEDKLLGKSIQMEGVRDRIIVWREKDEIIDGINRYRWARHWKQAYEVEYKNFETLDEVIDWCIDNQFGRRNLSELQDQYRIGRRYESEKQKHGGQIPGRGILQNEESLSTVEKIAKEENVSKSTVERAGAVARAIDSAPPEDKPDILAGKKPVPKTLSARKKKQGEAIFSIDPLHQLAGQIERYIDKMCVAYGYVDEKRGTVKEPMEVLGLRREFRAWRKNFETEQRRLHKAYMERNGK
jgi:hypothetical protein